MDYYEVNYFVIVLANWVTIYDVVQGFSLIKRAVNIKKGNIPFNTAVSKIDFNWKDGVKKAVMCYKEAEDKSMNLKGDVN